MADELHGFPVFVGSGTIEGWSNGICVSPVSPASPGWNSDTSTTELVVFAGSAVSGTDFAVGSMVVGDLTSVVTGVLLGVTPNNGMFVTQINVFSAACGGG